MSSTKLRFCKCTLVSSVTLILTSSFVGPGAERNCPLCRYVHAVPAKSLGLSLLSVI